MNRPRDIFEDARRLVLPDGDGEVVLHALGSLKVTSGKLTACDPLVCARDAPPFERSVPPGEYPVEVSVLTLADGGRPVAFARVRFGAGEPVRWENAAPEGTHLGQRKSGEPHGYGVDAGAGCFGDVSTLRAFDACGEDASAEMLQALARSSENRWSWADITCGDAGENVIAFSSGWGDGFYFSFWGLDSAGTPVCLVTDFGVCAVDWASVVDPPPSKE